MFKGEAEQSHNLVYEQALMTVGNTPADRIQYLKDFESWKERLITLLKISLDCITKEQWLGELEEFMPPKSLLVREDKQKFGEKFRRHFQKGENIFTEIRYIEKYSEFTLEALGLLRRFSAMHNITMERTEWIVQGLKNIGKLPMNIKYKKSVDKIPKDLRQIDTPSITSEQNSGNAGEKTLPKVSDISEVIKKLKVLKKAKQDYWRNCAVKIIRQGVECEPDKHKLWVEYVQPYIDSIIAHFKKIKLYDCIRFNGTETYKSDATINRLIDGQGVDSAEADDLLMDEIIKEIETVKKNLEKQNSGNIGVATPSDLIDLAKAVSEYHRSRAQLKRDIDSGKIKSYRKKTRGKHYISVSEANKLYLSKNSLA